MASKEREAFGKGGAQGIVFRLVTGESPSNHERASTGDTHKRRELKENIKGESAAPDYKNCPACDGMEVRYIDPLDYSKGTIKCKHERLGK